MPVCVVFGGNRVSRRSGCCRGGCSAGKWNFRHGVAVTRQKLLHDVSTLVFSAMNFASASPYTAATSLHESPDTKVYHVLQYGVIPEAVALGAAR